MRARLSASLILSAGLGLLMLAAVSSRPAQAQDVCDRYVLSPEGQDSTDCSDEQQPCRTVQYALGQAAGGETICVADHTSHAGPSVYTGTMVVDRSVTLDGAWQATCTAPGTGCAFTGTACNAEAVILDAQSAGRVITVSAGTSAVIDCFTITGGDATGLGGGTADYDVGGGVYARLADTTVANCIITDNVASRSVTAWGGGLGFIGGTATLLDSRLQGNVASTSSGSGYGGGAYFRGVHATVSGNIIAGNTAAETGYGYGGGLCFMWGDAALEDNTVEGNTANTSGLGYGGGIDLYGNDATIAGGGVRDNQANTSGMNGYGGGVSAREGSALTLNGVDVFSNTATFGGGVYVSESPLSSLTQVAIHANTAGMGGGLYLTQSPTSTLGSSQIHDNLAEYGAGAWINSSGSVSLARNLVFSNTSVGLAGGLWLTGSDDAALSANQVCNNVASGDGAGILFLNCSNATLESNLVADNQITTAGEGPGINLQTTSARLLHTTLARNQGGSGEGLYVAYTSTVALTNTVLVSHTIGIYVSGDSNAALEATLWGDGSWANVTPWAGSGTLSTGTLNLWESPGFACSGGGDYHLGPGSAAIDAGLEAGVTIDIDGDPRRIGALPDIGADEARLRVFLPLVLR